jgi:hypothetical protein
MSVQFVLMLLVCSNVHREIPDGWYGKASSQIRFTRRLAII